MSKLKCVIKEESDLVNSFKFLNPVDDQDEREGIVRRLQELKREENRVRSLTNDELFDGECNEYDWMKISALGFDGHISPESCRLFQNSGFFLCIQMERLKKLNAHVGM